MVVRTSENGGRKCHKHHVIGKEVEECTIRKEGMTVSSRDVGISHRKEGTTMSSRGEEMVHENQNHEYFEVKGGGRQRLRHVDDDFLSCMKTKKVRVWMKGRGGGRKEPRFINGDVPRCTRNKREILKFRSKNEGRGEPLAAGSKSGPSCSRVEGFWAALSRTGHLRPGCSRRP